MSASVRGQQLAAEFDALVDAVTHASVELITALKTQGAMTVGVEGLARVALDNLKKCSTIADGHVR